MTRRFASRFGAENIGETKLGDGGYCADGTVTVVVHSTHQFSMAASPDVYGSTSSAARHRGSSIPEAGGQSPEAELIESLLLVSIIVFRRV